MSKLRAGVYVGQIPNTSPAVDTAATSRILGLVGKTSRYRIVKRALIVRGYVTDEALSFSGSPRTATLSYTAKLDQSAAFLRTGGKVLIAPNRWSFGVGGTTVIIQDSVYDPTETYTLSYQSTSQTLKDTLPDSLLTDDESETTIRQILACGDNPDSRKYNEFEDFIITQTIGTPALTSTEDDQAFSSVTAGSSNTGSGVIALGTLADYTENYTRKYTLTCILSGSPSTAQFSWTAETVSRGVSAAPPTPLHSTMDAPIITGGTNVILTDAVAGSAYGVRVTTSGTTFNVGDTFTFYAYGPALIEKIAEYSNTNQSPTLSIDPSNESSTSQVRLHNSSDYEGDYNRLYSLYVYGLTESYGLADSGQNPTTTSSTTARVLFCQVDNVGGSSVSGINLAAGLAAIGSGAHTFKIKIGSNTAQSLSCTPGATPTGAALAASMQTAIRAAGGDYALVTVGYVAAASSDDFLYVNSPDGQVVITATGAGTDLTALVKLGTANGGLEYHDRVCLDLGTGVSTLANAVSTLQTQIRAVGSNYATVNVYGFSESPTTGSDDFIRVVSAAQGHDSAVTFYSAAGTYRDVAAALKLGVANSGTEYGGDEFPATVGYSLSGDNPATTTSGSTDRFRITLDGLSQQSIEMSGTGSTGPEVAEKIEDAINALSSTNARYGYVSCRYRINGTGVFNYYIESGSGTDTVNSNPSWKYTKRWGGPSSRVVISAATTEDATATLELGTVNGGLEASGVRQTTFTGLEYGIGTEREFVRTAIDGTTSSTKAVEISDGVYINVDYDLDDPEANFTIGNTWLITALTAKKYYTAHDERSYNFALTAKAAATITIFYYGNTQESGNGTEVATGNADLGTYVLALGDGLELVVNNLGRTGIDGSAVNRWTASDTWTWGITMGTTIDWTLWARETETVSESEIRQDVLGIITGRAGQYYCVLNKLPLDDDDYSTSKPNLLGVFKRDESSSADWDEITLAAVTNEELEDDVGTVPGNSYTLSAYPIYARDGLSVSWTSGSVTKTMTFNEFGTATGDGNTGSSSVNFRTGQITLNTAGSTPDANSSVTASYTPLARMVEDSNGVSTQYLLLGNNPSSDIVVKYHWKSDEPDFGASYYMSCKILRPASDFARGVRIRSLDEAEDFLLPADTNNDLLMAARVAFSQGRRPPAIYLFPVEDQDLDGSYTNADYQEAIDRSEMVAVVTDLVILQRPQVLGHALSSIEEMNHPYVKKQRTLWVGVDSSYAVGDVETSGTLVYLSRTTLQFYGNSPARGCVTLCGNREFKYELVLEDKTTVDVDLDGSYWAVAAAAWNAGQCEIDPADTLLYKTLSGSKLTDEMKTLTEADQGEFINHNIWFVNNKGSEASPVWQVQESTTVDESAPDYNEISAMNQKLWMTKFMIDQLQKSVISFVPPSVKAGVSMLRAFVAIALLNALSRERIAAYTDDSGNIRNLDAKADIDVFIDPNDKRVFWFKYWYELRYPQKKAFGLYSVDQRLFTSSGS